LITPKNEPKGGSPILCYQHGTQLQRKFAPSQFYDANEQKRKDENFMEVYIAAAFAALDKHAVVMADYHSMGDDQKTKINYVQPYMAAEPLAESVIDILKHVIDDNRKSNPDYKEWKWNGQLFLVGYSQGGFVTMAAARRLCEMAQTTDFKVFITGCAPMAGPYALSTAMLPIMIRKEPPYAWGFFLPMTIRGYYHRYDQDKKKPERAGFFAKENSLKKIDSEKYYILWDKVDGTKSEDDVQKWMNSNGAVVPSVILTQKMKEALENKSHEVYKTLEENEPYKWTHKNLNDGKLRIHLYHGIIDNTVPPESSEEAYKWLKRHESEYNLDVTSSFGVLPNVILLARGASYHVASAIPCFELASQWIQFIRPI
jgi:pimeloyl-ACP methyl ester carboxylesterase